MKKSVGKNYIYNLIYQLLVLIVPLITTPYLSRILGPEGIGKFSFTNSLATYFTLFAALGFGFYAQREIASFQDNKHEQSKIFWEIIILRSFSVTISILVNVILCASNVYQNYSVLMWYWLLLIGAQLFDITFIFQGNEEFGKIVIRNLFAKILSLVLIFVFVKQENQVWVYIICYCMSTLVGNLLMWIHLPRMIEKVRFSELHFFRHLGPTLRLFLPTIATSVYTMLDKTFIGLMITDTYTETIDGVDVIKRFSDLEDGYYEQSEKLVKLCMTIVTSLGAVFIPRNSHLVAEGKKEQLQNNIYFSLNFVWLVGAPITFGLAAIAPNFLPWFLGAGFQKSILLMQLLSPLVLIIGFSNVFGIQYLICTSQDNKYLIGVVVGAVVNLILNLVLIPLLWSIGAVIATIAAELCITLVMIVFCRKELNVAKLFTLSWKYLLSALVMFGVVYTLQRFFEPEIWYTVLLIVIGVNAYGLLLLILRDKFSLILIKKICTFFNKCKKSTHN